MLLWCIPACFRGFPVYLGVSESQLFWGFSEEDMQEWAACGPDGDERQYFTFGS